MKWFLAKLGAVVDRVALAVQRAGDVVWRWQGAAEDRATERERKARKNLQGRG